MSGTILLVDDDRAHRQICKRLIERSPLALGVVEAESLAEATEHLTHGGALGELRVVLVDLRLRDGLGTTLLSQIKSRVFQRYGDALPVIILSTSALESDRHRCLALGADQYLVKNEDLQRFSEELIAVLSRFLIS